MAIGLGNVEAAEDGRTEQIWWSYQTQVQLLVTQESNTEKQVLDRKNNSFIEEARRGKKVKKLRNIICFFQFY